MIQAIRYCKENGTQPHRFEFQTDKPVDMLTALNSNLPALFIVTSKDPFKDIKINNKKIEIHSQIGAKEPKRYFLNRDSRIILESKYSSGRRAESAIDNFWKQALGADEEKFYIIVVKEHVYQLFIKKCPQEIEFFDSPSRNNTGDDDSQSQKIKKSDTKPESDSIPNLSDNYIGISEHAQRVRELIDRAASNDDIVLILGPTGTGKELIAKLIHAQSRRSKTNHYTINCATLQDTLFESDLFGHKKGAFTGAYYDKKGVFELANKTTLFLDEIGDLDLRNQAKILRVLEDNQITPVGGENSKYIDVRIIAATNRDLYSMVKTGHFREDLYFRLAVFVIKTKGLKDVPEDIPLHVEHIWEKLMEKKENESPLAKQYKEKLKLGKEIPEEIMQKIKNLPWPGNVRQLKATLTRVYSYFWDIGPLDLTMFNEAMAFDNFGESENTRNVSSLVKNKSAEDNIRIIQNGLKYMMEKKQTQKEPDNFISNYMNSFLKEINGLCELSLNQRAYVHAAINNLYGKLSYLDNLLKKNIQAANVYWSGDICEAFEAALEALQKEKSEITFK